MSCEQDILDLHTEMQRMREAFGRMERDLRELREQVDQETVRRRQAVAHVRDRGLPQWVS